MTIGRLEVSERHELSEQHNAGTGERTIQVTGQHFIGYRGADLAEVQRKQEDILGLADRIVPVRFSNKSDQDGFYRVQDVGASVLDWPEDMMRSFEWNFILSKYGPDNVLDIESRMGTVVRANNYVLTGERWHAPPIGHTAYFTGSTLPSTSMTRTGTDGAITIYRTIPANINPRYACSALAYPAGRVRVLTGGFERTGVGIRASATGWELNNGLVRVTPLLAAGMLQVSAWGGTAWETKAWHIARGGATTSLGNFDSMTVIRNDFELATIRLLKAHTIGRTYVDVSLRRGSRLAEVYIQTDVSSTLGAYLETTETASNQTATGYVTATADDADGNRFIVGSSKTVAYTTDRGISKAAVTGLDVYLGVVFAGGSAAAGDAATVLRDQYIGAVSETTAVVKR